MSNNNSRKIITCNRIEIRSREIPYSTKRAYYAEINLKYCASLEDSILTRELEVPLPGEGKSKAARKVRRALYHEGLNYSARQIREMII